MPMIEAAKDGAVDEAVCSCHDCVRGMLERALGAVVVDDEMVTAFDTAATDGHSQITWSTHAGLEAVFRVR